MEHAKRTSPAMSSLSITQTLPRWELVSTARIRIHAIIEMRSSNHGKNRNFDGRRRLSRTKCRHPCRRTTSARVGLRYAGHKEWMGRPGARRSRTADGLLSDRYPSPRRYDPRHFAHKPIQEDRLFRTT